MEALFLGSHTLDALIGGFLYPRKGVPAREWLKSITADELAWVIYNYGEDSDPCLAERLAEIILAKQESLHSRLMAVG